MIPAFVQRLRQAAGESIAQRRRDMRTPKAEGAMVRCSFCNRVHRRRDPHIGIRVLERKS